mgnify:CR=1 FL=1
MGKIGRVMGRMATNTILVQPIRILIIINSIFLPLLLGTLVFIILRYAQEIEGIITEAQKIEEMVRDNINDGIKIIKDKYSEIETTLIDKSKLFTKENAKKFIKETILKPLILYINPELENFKTKVQEFINKVTDFSKIKLEEFTTILDVSGKSVNNIIKSIEPMLLSENLCKPEQINKVLKENRSIAYILTHNEFNN